MTDRNLSSHPCDLRAGEVSRNESLLKSREAAHGGSSSTKRAWKSGGERLGRMKSEEGYINISRPAISTQSGSESEPRHSHKKISLIPRAEVRASGRRPYSYRRNIDPSQPERMPGAEENLGQRKQKNPYPSNTSSNSSGDKASDGGVPRRGRGEQSYIDRSLMNKSDFISTGVETPCKPENRVGRNKMHEAKTTTNTSIGAVAASMLCTPGGAAKDDTKIKGKENRKSQNEKRRVNRPPAIKPDNTSSMSIRTKAGRKREASLNGNYIRISRGRLRCV